MKYSVNDVLNILFMCGIKTTHNLKTHFERGQFQVSEKNFERKLERFESGEILMDQRQSNKRPNILEKEDLYVFENTLDKYP